MKRLLDICLSLVGLIILIPIFVCIAFGIALFMGRPVFFKQSRLGLKSTVFTIYKFRTMSNENGSDSAVLNDEERITALGHFLRTTSADELPELWNVLRGDMSLVGPRPLLTEYRSYYSKEQNRRHDVRPGLTGWAQINGRNHISWEERLSLDVWYVDNQSVCLDVKILVLTLFKVFTREGVYSSRGGLMQKFQGTKKNCKN